MKNCESKAPVSGELEAEVSGNNCQTCRKAKFVYLRGNFDRGGEESEDERIEEYSASSSDNPMRVWYPRHSMRV